MSGARLKPRKGAKKPGAKRRTDKHSDERAVPAALNFAERVKAGSMARDRALLAVDAQLATVKTMVSQAVAHAAAGHLDTDSRTRAALDAVDDVRAALRGLLSDEGGDE